MKTSKNQSSMNAKELFIKTHGPSDKGSLEEFIYDLDSLLSSQQGKSAEDKFALSWELAKDFQSTWKGHSQQEQYDFHAGAVAMYDYLSSSRPVGEDVLMQFGVFCQNIHNWYTSADPNDNGFSHIKTPEELLTQFKSQHPELLQEKREMSFAEFMIQVVKLEPKYSIQYSDYDEGTWTVPSLLTHKRLADFMDDTSVKNIRLEFNKKGTEK